MTDSLAAEQKKSRRGLLALAGAGGAAAVAALLGRSDKTEAAPLETFLLGLINDSWTVGSELRSNSSDHTLKVVNGYTGWWASGIDSRTSGPGGWGVYAESSGSSGAAVRAEATGANSDGVSAWGKRIGVFGSSTSDSGNGVEGWASSGTGVWGLSNNSAGVKGTGKPGVYGICNKDNGSGVKGEGNAPGTIGVLAKNTPDRRALRTKGRVQMDTARKVTLSNRSNLVTLPTGVEAGAFAIVLAMAQGASGNGAFVRRAWRVDDKHIRITFDKKPANPTAVGYWVVQTG